MFVEPLTAFDGIFSTTKTTTLVSGAEILTLQKPASAQKSIRLISVYAFCTVAATVTLERSGTVASTAVNPIVNCNPNLPNVLATQAAAFNTSNVGVGTVINVFSLTTTQPPVTLDASMFVLPGGALDNITLRSNAVTGTITLQFMWKEF